MMMRFVIAAAAVVSLTACSQPRSDLAGRWEVQQIAGASLGDGVDIWIEFDEAGDTVRGFTGCRAFTGDAEVFGAMLTLAPVVEEQGSLIRPFGSGCADTEKPVRPAWSVAADVPPDLQADVFSSTSAP